MQATPQVRRHGRTGRTLSYFLAAPLTALALLTLALALTVASYQSRHIGRVYTGVRMGTVDLSGLTAGEAAAALKNSMPYLEQTAVTLTDPATGRQWQFTPYELGLSVDAVQIGERAMTVGRGGSPLAKIQAMFQAWYYGRQVAPVFMLDEGMMQAALAQIAADIYTPAVNAELRYDGETAVYTSGQTGRALDMADAYERLRPALLGFQSGEIELLIHDTAPAISDSPEMAAKVQQFLHNPITFYLPQPLDGLDLGRVELPQTELTHWLRVDTTNNTHRLYLDENGARAWLQQFARQIYREPVNARFYFDDDTRELVLVAPHVNGRELDIEATLAQLQAQVDTPNRSVPFIVNEIVPAVNAKATAADLGITELIREQTTWFYGSSDARKHNIARSAANFYGIVIAPGEEFSFNKYLGSISEDDGYTEGLIIVGGQTIKGVGGGVCQVSTSIYQTVFWSGFPIVERWEHGYWLDYYNDGEGPGMDATVYSPIVDFRFINNTPYHLLIENYYNTAEESLTFKFYSTSMGRKVEKEGPYFDNMTEVPGPDQDRWEFDPDLPEGTVEQIDWATQGTDVSVRRIITNADGVVIEDRWFNSHYIPYPNTFHYGPGVDAPNYALVPPPKRR
ncbi:MAG: VanW family protein [Anaerolineae bacterium]